MTPGLLELLCQPAPLQPLVLVLCPPSPTPFLSCIEFVLAPYDMAAQLHG